jgi:hypothetical protein
MMSTPGVLGIPVAPCCTRLGEQLLKCKLNSDVCRRLLRPHVQNNHAVKVVALNLDFTVLRALKTLVRHFLKSVKTWVPL